ncbi:MAG TPA: hydantoinase/oxoprolinase family protein, partial [Hyphomicrobiaceae bacterium]|nr:hydantoinase/oxoprolinase family protein [Hyphomicrobiaceae bacterium]
AQTAAAAVIDVVNHEMAEALKIVSVQRGYDPREFTLAAFGGAGPLHACALASELGMTEVLCPPIPGAFSALGLVGTDLKRDYVRTFYTTTDKATPTDLTAAFAALEADGTGMLERARVPASRRRFDRGIDARYARQSHELYVPVPDPPYDAATIEAIAQAFHERHRQTYGHDNRSEPVQLVNVRLAAVGEIPALKMRQETGDGTASPIKGRRTLWFRKGGKVDAAILDRNALPAGFSMQGPCVVESLESTILVAPGWTISVDADGFILLTHNTAGAAAGGIRA